jgi:hypothetical protein
MVNLAGSAPILRPSSLRLSHSQTGTCKRRMALNVLAKLPDNSLAMIA